MSIKDYELDDIRFQIEQLQTTVRSIQADIRYIQNNGNVQWPANTAVRTTILNANILDTRIESLLTTLSKLPYEES